LSDERKAQTGNFDQRWLAEGSAMSEEERFRKGAANFRKVYGDVLPMPDRMDADAFTSMTFRNLFGDVWGRDQMSMRERRL
jgi:alkylhydroperoxidase/carboxymuconolactone decarboxylase family protein YurZ